MRPSRRPTDFADRLSFEAAIAADPTDSTVRCAYSDWLEDHDLHHSDDSRCWLRQATEAAVFAVVSGRVWCGRRWLLSEVLAQRKAGGDYFSTKMRWSEPATGPRGCVLVCTACSVPGWLYQWLPTERRLQQLLPLRGVTREATVAAALARRQAGLPTRVPAKEAERLQLYLRLRELR